MRFTLQYAVEIYKFFKINCKEKNGKRKIQKSNPASMLIPCHIFVSVLS
jgi:uncharacterized protein (DUF302 family)